MGKEIRKVPKDWEHPRDEHGKYRPMFNESYEDKLEEWIANHRLWQEGKHPLQIDCPEVSIENRFYAEWAGNPPNIEYYNPNKWSEQEAVCFQVYENITEGTPISRVFDSLKEVESWLIMAAGYEKNRAREFCKNGLETTYTYFLPKEGIADKFILKDQKKLPVKKRGKGRGL